MLRSWLVRRREAKMRARDYAHYYLRTFGNGAEAALAERAGVPGLGAYRRLLYRFTARELRALRRLQGARGPRRLT